jgi:hypothetical protein
MKKSSCKSGSKSMSKGGKASAKKLPPWLTKKDEKSSKK